MMRSDIPQRRILFLPADSLPSELTRSYWLAKGLSHNHVVYMLQWRDPRTESLMTYVHSRTNTILSFCRSLFSRIVIKPERTEGNGVLISVHAPVMINAVIHNLLGQSTARRFCRLFNRIILKILLERIKPDVIFYADAFYYFPPVARAGCDIYADIQDDFDEENELLLSRELAYGRKCYALCKRVYAVSPGTAERLAKLYGREFEWLPNGADFRRFQTTSQGEAVKLKKRMKLEGRFVLSYIGTAGIFDEQFVRELSLRLAREMPEAVILLVGVGMKSDEGNIVSTGFIPPEEVHLYFLASDVGFFAPPNGSRNFIYHALPLKIVQYSAAQKHVISIPIHWLLCNRFPNVSVISPDVSLWVEEVKRLKSIEWHPEWDKVWESYDWPKIGERISRNVAG